MVKPAKPGSVRRYVEDRLQAIPGYENINDVLPKASDGNKADYLLFDRRIIVEQKDFVNSSEHREKGRRFQEYSSVIFKKYGIDPINPDITKHDLLSNEEKDILHKLRGKFYNKIKLDISEANYQIEATKRTLKLPNALGVVLMIFDQVNGIMPPVISERVFRVFDTLRDGKPLYNHVDIFIFSLRMKALLYNGSSFVNGHITRDESTEAAQYARMILDGLKSQMGHARPRTTFNKYDIIQQLVPNVFDV